MKKWLQVISLAISFFLIGLFIPYGMNIPIPSDTLIMSGNNNTTCFGCGQTQDPAIMILFAVLLPIVSIIALMLLYFPKKKEDDSNG